TSDCVFFFQAEDGIRDATVTGVQTCALPIFKIRGSRNLGAPRPDRPSANFTSGAIRRKNTPTRASSLKISKHRTGHGTRWPRVRSEERRVGKEWRGRRGVYG